MDIEYVLGFFFCEDGVFVLWLYIQAILGPVENLMIVI